MCKLQNVRVIGTFGQIAVTAVGATSLYMLCMLQPHPHIPLSSVIMVMSSHAVPVKIKRNLITRVKFHIRFGSKICPVVLNMDD